MIMDLKKIAYNFLKIIFLTHMYTYIHVYIHINILFDFNKDLSHLFFMQNFVTR